ncbi:WD40-repeat-containing domain protein [Coniochaeta sp. 2T2.1]|nr:WD40-repeat-containing domain protein [Coniochaeta sp. 2T2.1]
MSMSTDRGHFFETDAEQATAARRAAKSNNKYGKPIVLKSKILAAIVDPHSPSSTVFVAESAGAVRRVNVDDEDVAAKKAAVYRGPITPVTSVAIGGPGKKTLFAGSWDKNVWSWDIDTRNPGRKYVGHSDFVKAVVCARLGGKNVLISGGADKKIMVWDVATGKRIHTLSDAVVNMMAVQHLVIDPVESNENELSLVSASSDPHIRRWKIRLDSWEQVAEADPDGTEKRTVLLHETSVYRLVFDHEGDEVDLWTSSGDGTAKCLSRVKGFASDDSLNHGDHVRAVAVTDRWIVTAGRDEDLKFWDRTSGKMYCSLVGHYDEVTDLVVLQGANQRLCSVSIDGTIRTWPLDAPSLDAQVKEQTSANPEKEEEKAEDDLLTAEEEAELAELMSDDD